LAEGELRMDFALDLFLVPFWLLADVGAGCLIRLLMSPKRTKLDSDRWMSA